MPESSIPELQPHTRTAHLEQFDAAPETVTYAVKRLEDDVRAILDYYGHDYCPPQLVHAVRRLRLLVGYGQ